MIDKQKNSDGLPMKEQKGYYLNGPPLSSISRNRLDLQELDPVEERTEEVE